MGNDYACLWVISYPFLSSLISLDAILSKKEPAAFPGRLNCWLRNKTRAGKPGASSVTVAREAFRFKTKEPDQ